MSDLADCLAEKSYTDSGIPIEGHRYESELAIYDKDTGRMYAVLECSRCHRHSVGWSTENLNPDGRYGTTYSVGGPE